jgi:CheY-like chemotaxis protein
MSADNDAFQYLLQGMRSSFLDDLQERCDQCDNLLLALEKTPDDRALLDELYRLVHNLKGSGGMNGLTVITRICHPLENCLTKMKKPGGSPSALEQAFKFIDLLRRVEQPGRAENPDYSVIEAELEALRRTIQQSGKVCLLADTSSMMMTVYKNALTKHGIRYTPTGNGMEALTTLLAEPFDLIITGRELPELNGLALIAALRASACPNQNTPVILVSSNLDHLPEWARLDAALARDNHLPANLEAALQKLNL